MGGREVARIRTIKPTFFVNDELAHLEPIVRLLFIGLWTVADREGRLEDRPMRIKAEVMPFDNIDIAASLTALENAGMIIRYQVNDRKFIEINNFRKHQKPHPKESPSTIPPCREEELLSREKVDPSREKDVSSRVDNGLWTHGHMDNTHMEACQPRHAPSVRVSFGEFWNLFPKKINRGLAEQAWNETATSPELAAEIITSLSEKLSHPDYQAEGGRYVPNAAKWLRERRWLDELPKATGPPAPRIPGRTTAEKMAAYFPAAEGT